MEHNSLERARNICIVTTLANLGYYPTRKSTKEAWFLSPLRSETQASFKVSLKLNLWYDFGIGEGGNSIDLIMALKNCSYKEAIQFLLNETSYESFIPVKKPEKRNLNSHQGIQILKTLPITHPGLLSYLEDRKISLSTARKYCREVHYQLNNKEYFSIGLQNSQNGWELRNRYFKNSSSPKSFTIIKNDARQLIITEGMFDFLSLGTIDKKLLAVSDCIILNSLAFIDRIKPLIANYDIVLLYLDNDPAGDTATKELTSHYSNLKDKSDLYQSYKDLNEKLKSELI
ncbi:toprim domain-containing protein [Salegentibacter sp. F14]